MYMAISIYIYIEIHQNIIETINNIKVLASSTEINVKFIEKLGNF